MSMAVLGLLVEQPDTVGGIGIRLERRFPDAHWSRSNVYGCVPSLVKQGYARLVKEGGKPALNRYGASSSGVACFRGWLHESVVVPVVSRDVLQGRLVFSTRADLAGLIGTVRERLDVCKQKYADRHRRYLEARSLSQRSADWDAEWDAVLLHADAKLWGAEVLRLRELLEDLEGLRGKHSTSVPGREAARG